MKWLVSIFFLFLLSCSPFQHKISVVYRLQTMETIYLSNICKMHFSNEANYNIIIYGTVEDCKAYIDYLGKEVKLKVVSVDLK